MSYNYFNSGFSTDYRSGYAGAKKKPSPSPWADGVVPGMSAFSQGMVPSIQQGGSFMSYPPMHHRDNEEQMSAFMRNNTMGDMRALYTRQALRRPLIQPGARPVSKGVSLKKTHPLSSGLLQAMNFSRGKAQFAGRITNKKIRDNRSTKNNRMTAKSDAFDENFDIPTQALKCLVCGKTSFRTLKGYIRHVKGKIHQDMLLLHQSRNDQYIKLLRTNALISNQKELKYADGPGRFCSLCQCTYLATGDAHRKNVEHILLKSQLVIRCCGKTMSISTVDEHRCSLQHLKMVHEKKQAVSDEQPSDADEDILTDLAAEYDVLGVGDSATSAYNPSKVFGLSLLKRKKLYHCEPCNTTLPTKQRIESHCRSEGHYVKVVAFLKQQGNSEKKRKTKKTGSEKEKEAAHDASENAADEQTDEELVEEANRALNQITLEEFNATGLDESGHVGHDEDEDENAIDSKDSDDTGSESDDEADTAEEDEEKQILQNESKNESLKEDEVEENEKAKTTKGEVKKDDELNHKPKVVQKESKKSEAESKDSVIKSERTKADSSSDEYAAAEEGLPSKEKSEKPKPKRSRKRVSQPEEKAEVSSAGCKEDQVD